MKRTRKALSLILSLLMLVSGLTLLASAADTYTPIPGTDCYWVKTNNFVSMSEIYMNERYSTSGSIRFYKLLSISIVDKGETGAYTIGQDDTFVKFTHSGKAVVSATAQIYKESTNSYTKDICSFTFYVSNSYKYLVIFEPNGGTGTASIYSGSATILKGDQPHFARTGYTLDGWANGPKNSAEYTGNVTAYEKAPQVLYAHWKPNTYTLSFNANGGTVSPTSKTVTYGSTFGTLPTPTRAGYRFDGWYGTASGGGQFTASSIYSFTSNLMVYAHWTKLSEISTIAVTGVSAPAVGAKPVTTGYTITSGVKVTEFKWTNTIAGGAHPATTDTTFQAGKEYGVSFRIVPADGYAFAPKASMTATVNGKAAEYKNDAPNVYYVSYVFGKLAEPIKLESVVITGVSAPAYNSTVTTSGVKASAGFTISDSYWSKKGSDGKYTKTTDTTFQRGGEYSLYISGKIASGYAAASTLKMAFGDKSATMQNNGGNYSASIRFDPVIQKVWVTFNPTGGTLADSEKTKLVTVDGVYGALPTPKKDGYTFDGWYVSWSGGDKAVSPTTKVEKTINHDLTAHWKVKAPATVTVTFDPNGGTVADADKTKTVTVGNAYGQLPIPTRDGYTFEGWFNSADTQITAATNVSASANHTLTAKWKKLEAKTVTVTFDATPGLVSDHSKTVTVGEKYGMLPIASRGGYKFLGWFDDTDAQITSLSTVNKTTDHTLKAKYESLATTVTVTFDPDGGAVTPTTKSVEPGKLYGELPVPTRGGYTFLGWYTKDSSKVTEDTAVPYSVDHTLKAKWAEDAAGPSTVTLDPGDGTVEGGSKTLEPGKPFGKLPTPTKPGFVFLGWFDKDGNKISPTDLVPSGNFTLTAKWEAEAAPHTEHVYDEGKVTKEATCTATGEKVFTCTVCGIAKTEVIPMAPHTYSDTLVTISPTCIATGEKSYTCTVCGGSYVEVIPKTAHSFETSVTPATLKKSGEIVGTCAICGETQRQSVIYRPKAFSLAATKFTYNGKAKKPTVTVKDAKGNLIDPENYTLKYSNNKQVGTAKVKITFKGDYSGSKTLKFQILPKKTAIQKLTAGTKAFKATWKQISSGDGYQLQYSTNKSFSKNVKTITIKDASVTARTVKNLQSGKTYYVRIRTLQVVDSKTYCAAWSKAVKVKTK